MYLEHCTDSVLVLELERKTTTQTQTNESKSMYVSMHVACRSSMYM